MLIYTNQYTMLMQFQVKEAESLTECINGHGDSMGGAIIGKTEYLDQIRAQSQVNPGGTISRFHA